MNKSETIGKLAEALAKAQGQMGSAAKTAANTFFKSTYADLSAIVDAIKKPLSENGLAYVQTTDISEDGAVIVETTLIHGSGEWLSGSLRMKPVKDDPQGIGSALTYARRYGLQAIVGLDADTDDDGNAASGKTAEQPKQQQAAKPSPPKSAPQVPTQPPEQPEEADERDNLINKITDCAIQLGKSDAKLNATAKKFDGSTDWRQAKIGFLRNYAKALSDEVVEKS